MRKAPRLLVAAAGVLLVLVAAFVLFTVRFYESSRQHRYVPDSGPMSLALPAGAPVASAGNLALSRFSIIRDSVRTWGRPSRGRKRGFGVAPPRGQRVIGLHQARRPGDDPRLWTAPLPRRVSASLLAVDWQSIAVE
jgi:hypothetical protein